MLEGIVRILGGGKGGRGIAIVKPVEKVIARVTGGWVVRASGE